MVCETDTDRIQRNAVYESSGTSQILIMKDGKINGEFLRSPDLKDTDLIDNMI